MMSIFTVTNRCVCLCSPREISWVVGFLCLINTYTMVVRSALAVTHSTIETPVVAGFMACIATNDDADVVETAAAERGDANSHELSACWAGWRKCCCCCDGGCIRSSPLVLLPLPAVNVHALPCR